MINNFDYFNYHIFSRNFPDAQPKKNTTEEPPGKIDSKKDALYDLNTDTD
jgi:hypothetical protein